MLKGGGGGVSRRRTADSWGATEAAPGGRSKEEKHDGAPIHVGWWCWQGPIIIVDEGPIIIIIIIIVDDDDRRMTPDAGGTVMKVVV